MGLKASLTRKKRSWVVPTPLACQEGSVRPSCSLAPSASLLVSWPFVTPINSLLGHYLLVITTPLYESGKKLDLFQALNICDPSQIKRGLELPARLGREIAHRLCYCALTLALLELSNSLLRHPGFHPILLRYSLRLSFFELSDAFLCHLQPLDERISNKLFRNCYYYSGYAVVKTELRQDRRNSF